MKSTGYDSNIVVMVSGFILFSHHHYHPETVCSNFWKDFREWYIVWEEKQGSFHCAVCCRGNTIWAINAVELWNEWNRFTVSHRKKNSFPSLSTSTPHEYNFGLETIKLRKPPPTSCVGASISYHHIQISIAKTHLLKPSAHTCVCVYIIR